MAGVKRHYEYLEVDFNDLAHDDTEGIEARLSEYLQEGWDWLYGDGHGHARLIREVEPPTSVEKN